MSFKE
jgi:hypothetical protein